MPSYNMGRFIEDAVGSALAQSYPIHELVVVDDGSTDDTTQRLADIRDARVRVLAASHGGVSRARNLALDHVSGDLVCFLDADDRWKTGKVAHDVAVFESEPTVGALFVNFRRFNEEGFYPLDQFTFYPELANVPSRTARGGLGRVITSDPFSALIGFETPPAWIAAHCFRVDVVRSLRFDPQLPVCEDLHFCLRAYRTTAVAFSDATLVEARRHPANATNNAESIPEAMYEALRRLEDEELTFAQRNALRARLSRILIGLGRQAAMDGRLAEALDRYAAAAARRPRWGSLLKNVALAPYHLLRRRAGGSPRL